MSGIGSNSFKNNFESIKLSDPSKKEAFKAAVVDAAKDGKIENKEFQNIKTNFLGKELSSEDQKSLNVLLQNLSSEVTNAFPLGSKINPDNVEKASVFLNNLLSNDVNVTSTTTDTSIKTPNTEPPVLKGHEELVNRVKIIVGTDIFEKLAQKFSGNDNADPTKLLECFQGIDELTNKNSTIEQRALGLQKVFVAGGLGIGDVINKAAQPILEKAGIGIKIESGSGNEIKASIFIGKVVDNEQIEDGDDKEIKGGYIEAKFNIETHEYDFSAKMGKFESDGEDINSIASLGFSFKQTSQAIESGSKNIVNYATKGTIREEGELASNGEDAELKDLVSYTTELDVLPDSVKADMKLRGIPEDGKKFFSVEVDLEGNVKTRLILQKEDTCSTKEKPSFKQYSIDLEVNAAKLIVDAAEGASKVLINKYGPQIAANVVSKVGVKAAGAALNGLSKAIPVVGQVAMAAQLGWEVGRLLGENVKIGDKTIDQHMQGMYKDAMLGENANLVEVEGKFKTGISPLSKAFHDAIRDLPPDDPKRELLQNLYDVKVTAMLAMGRPNSLTDLECKSAKEKIELLQKLNVLDEKQANELLLPINKAQEKSKSHLSVNKFKIAEELSHQLPRSGMSDKEAIDFGRKVIANLKADLITPEDAKKLINYLPPNIVRNEELTSAISNYGNTNNINSNTLNAEIEFAENINGTKERLIQSSKGNDSFITQALKSNNQDRALTLISKSDLEEKNSEGDTALTSAIKRNDLESVKFLLENGADPNGNESLFVAIKENKPEMLKFLLENGANIDLKNKDGKTVIDILDSKPPRGTGPIKLSELKKEQENIEINLKLKEIIINKK